MATSGITIDPAYSALREFVNPHVGILKGLWRCKIPGHLPRTYLLGGVSTNTAQLYEGLIPDGGPLYGVGINVNLNLAEYACILEGIERYCAGIPQYEDMLWGDERDLAREGHRTIPMERYDTFDARQYESLPVSPWTSESLVRWCEGRALPHGERVWLPAQLVYMPYVRLSQEIALGESVSTGLAAGRTFPKAVYSGLCEVIERDAFTIYWQAMWAAPTVEVESTVGLSPDIDRIVGELRKFNYIDLTFKDITSNIGIPTMLTVIRNSREPRAPATCFSAASDLNPVVALEKALNEALGSYLFAHRLTRDDAKSIYRDIEVNPAMWERTHSFDEHVAIAAHPAFLEYITWVDQGERQSMAEVVERYRLPESLAEVRSIHAAREDAVQQYLELCCERLASQNLDAYSVDVTSGEVREMGFSVARVVAPGTVPLNCDHRFRPMACKRILEVPEVATRGGKLNGVPHPYP